MSLFSNRELPHDSTFMAQKDHEMGHILFAAFHIYILLDLNLMDVNGINSYTTVIKYTNIFAVWCLYWCSKLATPSFSELRVIQTGINSSSV